MNGLSKLVTMLAMTSICVFPIVSSGAVLDYVDLGKEASEAGHNLQGWGPIEPENSGGLYGGIDDCRACYAPGEDEPNDWATVDLDFGSSDETCKRLVIHHLDGHACDSFDVYLGSHLVFSYLGNDLEDEVWMESVVTLVEAGVQTVKFVSTEEVWSGWETYGQMCFDLLKVEECPMDCSNLDFVDIGDVDSEAGHQLVGWGPIEPETSGGNYGGIDNCRAVYSSYDGDRMASLELSFGVDELSAKCLTLHHLDGLTMDAFDAYLHPKGKPELAKRIYSYPGDDLASEIWHCKSIEVSGCGIHVLTLESTAPQWSGWETYGQMCFDIIRVDECPDQIDMVDVGNEASEAGHNLADWGPIEPFTSGGGYGGVDDCRAVYAPDDCDGNRWATLDMDFGCCEGLKCLTVQHLEGLATNDAFELYVYPAGTTRPDSPDFVWEGDESSIEYWMISGVLLDRTGINTLEFISTEPEWSDWETYGQMCIDTLIVSAYRPIKDSVDIGNEASEFGHDLQGWGPIEPLTSGGSYGGIPNCRPIYAPEDGDDWATLVMDFGYCCSECKVLNLHHLDGMTCDAFEVYVYPIGGNRPDDPLYVYSGDDSSSEIWYETKIATSCLGKQIVELVSLGEPWSGWETYGQMCFDLIRVECCQPCEPTPIMVSTGLPDSGQATEFTGFTSFVPNPFNPNTEISFRLYREGRVVMSIHDIRGRLVRTLVDGHLIGTNHTLTWDGTDRSGSPVTSGVYLVLLRVDGDRMDSGKLVLLK